MDCGYEYEISKPPIKCRFQHPIQFVGNLETRGGVTSCYKFADDIKIEKRVPLFLFRTPFIFQVPQDIVVWSIYPKVGISPTKRYISGLKIFVISVLYPNIGGWIRAYGFAHFIVPKPHLSGSWFDTKTEDAINCIYPFGICNNFI